MNKTIIQIQQNEKSILNIYTIRETLQIVNGFPGNSKSTWRKLTAGYINEDLNVISESLIVFKGN